MRHYYMVKREGFWLQGLHDAETRAAAIALQCVKDGASVAHVYRVELPSLEHSHDLHCATGRFPVPMPIGPYVAIFNRASLAR